MIEKYRKKATEIEAILWDGTKEVAQIINNWNEMRFWPIKDDRRMIISTFEGPRIACVGDYIIKDKLGEFYPCNAETFAMMYERVV